MSFEATPIDPNLKQLAEEIGSAMVEQLFARLRTGDLVIPPEYLNSRQVAQMTGVSVKSLEAMRSMRRGPDYFKIGGRVRYRIQDIRDWIEAGGPVD